MVIVQGWAKAPPGLDQLPGVRRPGAALACGGPVPHRSPSLNLTKMVIVQGWAKAPPGLDSTPWSAAAWRRFGLRRPGAAPFTVTQPNKDHDSSGLGQSAAGP